jgi:integral membrane sensor domain MASE1
MVSVGFTLINLGESLAAAVLVRRVTPDAIRLRHPADMLSLTALCAVAATTGAVFAATLAWTALHAHFWTALVTWVAADISGMLTIGPVVLAIARRTDSGIPWTVRRVVECALMLIVLGASSGWIFFSPAYGGTDATDTALPAAAVGDLGGVSLRCAGHDLVAADLE